MTTNRRWIDRDNAEYLLRGAPARRLQARDPLSQLLRAAAAPVSADELADEHEAMAVFQRNAHGPVSTPRRKSMIKTALAKVLTLKAAAVLAAVSAGGVALAATTGVMPNPLEQFLPGSHAPADPTDKPTSPGPGGAHGTPSPSIVGLCHAFVAGAGADHGKALENPAFTALITAAGGKDKVDAYCTNVLASAEPTSHPTGEPTTRPTSEPPHPTGQPSHPTGDPTSHPSGPPTTHSAG
jgi:hypothetical protein